MTHCKTIQCQKLSSTGQGQKLKMLVTVTALLFTIMCSTDVSMYYFDYY